MHNIALTMQEMKEFCSKNVSDHVFAFSKIGPSLSVDRCEPDELIFQTDRFDLMVKMVLVYSLEYKLQAKWFQDLYVQHIRYFNNFHEANFPNRKTGEDFLEKFLYLFNIYEKDESILLRTIPINQEKNIIDGAHRLALAAVKNNWIYTVTLDKQYPQTHYCFDYGFFVRKGMPYRYSDYIASLYCKLCNEAHLMLLFPRCKDKWTAIHNIIKDKTDIFYCRSIAFSKVGTERLIRLVYAEESWLDEVVNERTGAEYKTEECFGKYANVLVYVLRSKNPEKVISLKKEIRELCQIGNHSVHSTDSISDTIRVAEAVFNGMTRRIINTSINKQFDNFNTLFAYFKEYISCNGLNKDLFCIDGSSVLSVCGLRDCYDLDFLYAGTDKLQDLPNKVECHNEYFVSKGFSEYISASIHEVIFNPDFYFYYNGIKIMRPEVLIKIKSNRNEPKDRADIQLINKYLLTEKKANESLMNDNNCDPEWYATIDSLIEHNIEFPNLPFLYLNARFTLLEDDIIQIKNWIKYIDSNYIFDINEFFYIFDLFRKIPLDVVRTFLNEVIRNNFRFFENMKCNEYLKIWVFLMLYVDKFGTSNQFIEILFDWSDD